jgi:hypothetical protein
MREWERKSFSCFHVSSQNVCISSIEIYCQHPCFQLPFFCPTFYFKKLKFYLSRERKKILQSVCAQRATFNPCAVHPFNFRITTKINSFNEWLIEPFYCIYKQLFCFKQKKYSFAINQRQNKLFFCFLSGFWLPLSCRWGRRNQDTWVCV